MRTVDDREPISVKTEVFEGPLELLLDLVERRKLLINDISLAEVTDEYMRQVSIMQELSLPNTAQFVQLAATLLLIKSKSLLPVLQLTEEEEQVIDDLEERLQRYAIIRKGAEVILREFGEMIATVRQYVPDTDPLFVTDQYSTTEALHTSIQNVLINLPRKEVKPKVKVRKVISLDEMIDRLERRIRSEMKLRFSELMEQDTEKPTLIVGFLAVLESVKQGGIMVKQAGKFTDIEIEVEQASTPRYY